MRWAAMMAAAGLCACHQGDDGKYPAADIAAKIAKASEAEAGRPVRVDTLPRDV